MTATKRQLPVLGLIHALRVLPLLLLLAFPAAQGQFTGTTDNATTAIKYHG